MRPVRDGLRVLCGRGRRSATKRCESVYAPAPGRAIPGRPPHRRRRTRMNRTLTHLLTRAAGERTDGQVLDAFVSGRDPGAFEGLVRRHGPMVLAVGLRVLRHRQDAE